MMNTPKTAQILCFKKLERKKLEKDSFQLYRTYGKVAVIEPQNKIFFSAT